MELPVWSKMKSSEFEFIQWTTMLFTFSVSRDTNGSIEFHGPIKLVSMKLENGIPWNSWKHWSHRNLESRCCIELHGISSNFESPIFDDTGNATRFYGTLRCISFDGIPWNSRKCLCHRNWENKTSMDSNGIPCNHPCHLKWQTRISIGFHGISPNIEFLNFDDNLIWFCSIDSYLWKVYLFHLLVF